MQALGKTDKCRRKRRATGIEIARLMQGDGGGDGGGDGSEGNGIKGSRSEHCSK